VDSIKGLSKEQALLALSTKSLSNEQTKQILVNAGIIASEDKIQAELVQSALADANLSKATQDLILKKLGLIDATTGEILIDKACTREKIENILISKGIAKADREAILSKLGLAGANGTTTLSFGLLTTATLKQVVAQAKLIATNPVTLIIAAAGATYLLNKAISSTIKSLKEQKELLEETEKSISDYNSEISEKEGQKNSNTETIEELKSSGNNIDNDTVKRLENENSVLEQQIQLLESLKETEKETARQTTIDILNNTAEVTRYTQVLNDLKNFDFQNLFKDIDILSTNTLSDSFEMAKEGNIKGAAKKIISKVHRNINPIAGIISWFKSKKENDESILEETDKQIKKVKILRTNLSRLEKDRDKMSKKKYDKKHNKLSDKLTTETSKLTENIQEIQKYQANLDISDPEYKKAQNVLDKYTASLAHTEDYNTFDKVINSEIYGKDKDKLIELAKQGKLTKEVLDDEYHNLSVIFDEWGYSIDDVTDKLISLGKEEEKIQKAKPFSERFSDLWGSDSFKDAREDLQKLSNESGITENDIKSLAQENSELAALLEDSGMSAQFAATCFEKVCAGADGFSTITEDALAIDRVLHQMDESLEKVATSKAAYDKGMEQKDYDYEYDSYQEAYKKGMEMFENGEYGRHFQTTMEYLLGEASYTMSIEEMYNAMKNLKDVFGEDASANGLGFLEKLYEHKEIFNEIEGSIEKLSDGGYKLNLNPEEFDDVAKALHMTTDGVTACVNAIGMFGDYHPYDIKELEEELKTIPAAVNDNDKAVLSIQMLEMNIRNAGKTGREFYQIMEDIRSMEGIELLDFGSTDPEVLQNTITRLKEMDQIEFHGENIDIDSVITSLHDEFDMAYEDIQIFIKNVNDQCNGLNFSDAEGKVISLKEALEKVKTAEDKAMAEDTKKTGKEVENTTEKVKDCSESIDELNKKNTEGVRKEFSLLTTGVGTLITSLACAIDQYDTLMRMHSQKLLEMLSLLFRLCLGLKKLAPLRLLGI